MADIVVNADDIEALMRRLRKHASAKELRKELYSGLNRVSKPVREEMKQATGEPPVLPTEHGLQSLAEKKQSVTASVTGGRNAGLRIRAKGRKGFDLGSVYRTGRLRHPVFGNRNVWVTQSQGVQPKWMDPTFEEQRGPVSKEMIDVLEGVARKVVGL